MCPMPWRPSCRESLGGDQLWVDRFVATHASILYFWILVVLYTVAPEVSYKFSELLEGHAVDTYGEFVDSNEELLKTLVRHPTVGTGAGTCHRLWAMIWREGAWSRGVGTSEELFLSPRERRNSQFCSTYGEKVQLSLDSPCGRSPLPSVPWSTTCQQTFICSTISKRHGSSPRTCGGHPFRTFTTSLLPFVTTSTSTSRP